MLTLFSLLLFHLWMRYVDNCREINLSFRFNPLNIKKSTLPVNHFLNVENEFGRNKISK